MMFTRPKIEARVPAVTCVWVSQSSLPVNRIPSREPGTGPVLRRHLQPASVRLDLRAETRVVRANEHAASSHAERWLELAE